MGEAHAPHTAAQANCLSNTTVAWPQSVMNSSSAWVALPWQALREKTGLRKSLQVLYPPGPACRCAQLNCGSLLSLVCLHPLLTRSYRAFLQSEKSLMHLDREIHSPLCQHLPMLGPAAMLQGMIFRGVKFQSSLSFTVLISSHKFI